MGCGIRVGVLGVGYGVFKPLRAPAAVSGLDRVLAGEEPLVVRARHVVERVRTKARPPTFRDRWDESGRAGRMTAEGY
jgi:hypothetical protein